MKLFERLHAYGVGARTLLDWLGEGGMPVTQEKADSRAAVCCSCPSNKPGDWLDRMAAEVAAGVMAQRRAKLAMGLRVRQEDNLHHCEVCHCHLPTKIWVPFDVIEARTTMATWKALPSHCWMVKESPVENSKPTTIK